MATRSSGTIVYGVTEDQKRKAAGRIDVGEVFEPYERAYRAVAVRGIDRPLPLPNL